MEETYYTQNVFRYWMNYMIPVPDDFPVHPDYLFGCDRSDFIAGFKQLHDVVNQIYADMRRDPAVYGLPLIENDKYREGSKERNTARHAIFRLGNLFYNLGQAGELRDGELAVDLKRYKEISKDKSVPGAPMILNQLGKFGFELTGFNGKGFDKGTEELRIAYPDNQHVMLAFKAFSMTVSPENHDNHHRIHKNFYLFHHRMFCEHDGKPAKSDLTDFVQMIGPDNRAFFNLFHQRMLENGYEIDFDKSYDWKLDYDKNKKYSYHFCRFQEDNFTVRLKLSNVARYSAYLDNIPERMQQSILNHWPCHHCREVCGLRVEFDFHGEHHEACVCGVFEFNQPKAEDLDHYMKLLELENQVLAESKN